MANLEDILPSDKQARRSLRDRLAHWEAVNAGCFNVTSSSLGFQIGLVGGGHELNFFGGGLGNTKHIDQRTNQVHVNALGPELRNQFERTMSLIWALIEAIGLDEAV